MNIPGHGPNRSNGLGSSVSSSQTCNVYYQVEPTVTQGYKDLQIPFQDRLQPDLEIFCWPFIITVSKPGTPCPTALMEYRHQKDWPHHLLVIKVGYKMLALLVMLTFWKWLKSSSTFGFFTTSETATVKCNVFTGNEPKILWPLNQPLVYIPH